MSLLAQSAFSTTITKGMISTVNVVKGLDLGEFSYITFNISCYGK